MPRASLHDLYVEDLRDLYSAETQLLKALPRMAKAADARELRAVFEEHLDVTRGQVERLDGIFAGLGEKPRGSKSVAMEGLIERAREAIERQAHPAVRDAALIGAGQRVEHHEMAGYECARTYARLLGYDEAAELLQEALDEEAEADVRLTELAQTVILIEAEDPEEDDEPAPKKKPTKRKAGAGKR
jgi:ferritin-like metal-binding protein YciE